MAGWASARVRSLPRAVSSETAAVEVQFQPAGAGTWAGTLTLGDRTYPLSGSATGIPLPKASLAVELAEAKSGQTGAVAVSFDAPARTAGAGTLTISLDSDWIWRRLLPCIAAVADARYRHAVGRVGAGFARAGRRVGGWIRQLHGPYGPFARTWQTRGMGLWVMSMLLAILTIVLLGTGLYKFLDWLTVSGGLWADGALGPSSHTPRPRRRQSSANPR